ncbi:hypothetical protein [Paenibacillus xylaniclasticus]|uniref:hypothetical protein n=1 Tax=Paenibacillus xylaniclasticus TaxID=588083 RepID=UPI000FDC5376|nr:MULTISPECIES: hypothetical protein [Paenibacillus]GFN33549.1 hypothetical protein PCURB6_38090 [Paenibacillus curdlanolyticus]
MKLKLDAAQQEAVMKELCLDKELQEVDMTEIMEVAGGAIGDILVNWPPRYSTDAVGEEDTTVTTMAIGEEGWITTLVIGEER